MVPIVFLILALLIFGGVQAFYMHYHHRIFAQYDSLSSRDKKASVIFSLAFSISLFLSPLFLFDDLYFWVVGREWPEDLIPSWFFVAAYILQYLGIATFLGFRQYKKRFK